MNSYRYVRRGIVLKSGIGPCKLQFLRLLIKPSNQITTYNQPYIRGNKTFLKQFEPLYRFCVFNRLINFLTIIFPLNNIHDYYFFLNFGPLYLNSIPMFNWNSFVHQITKIPSTLGRFVVLTYLQRRDKKWTYSFINFDMFA